VPQQQQQQQQQKQQQQRAATTHIRQPHSPVTKRSSETMLGAHDKHARCVGNDE
jgi:hypothetical protein